MSEEALKELRNQLAREIDLQRKLIAAEERAERMRAFLIAALIKRGEVLVVTDKDMVDTLGFDVETLVHRNTRQQQTSRYVSAVPRG